MRSFSDPDTHFHLIRSDTPVNVDGFKLGEFTGEVQCLECDEIAMTPEDISHPADCGQRFVVSRYWADRMQAE